MDLPILADPAVDFLIADPASTAWSTRLYQFSSGLLTLLWKCHTISVMHWLSLCQVWFPLLPKIKLKQRVWKWFGRVFLPDVGERWLSSVFGALWSLLGRGRLAISTFILGAGLLSWFIFCFEPAGGSWRETLVFQLHLPSFGSSAGVMMWCSVNWESSGLALAFLSR